MSIFSRIRDIVENGIDSLDKTEDLERMVEQNLKELNRDLGKLKVEMATILAEEQRLKRELNECQEGIEKMERYSDKALNEGNEGDARTFQEKKAVLAEKLSKLQAAIQLASSKSEQLKPIQDQRIADIGELESIKRTGF